MIFYTVNYSSELERTFSIKKLMLEKQHAGKRAVLTREHEKGKNTFKVFLFHFIEYSFYRILTE